MRETANAGLLVGDTVRCPRHHACFSLRSGKPLRPPALDPVSCRRVEQRDGKVYVREKLAHVESSRVAAAKDKTPSMIIEGGGGAGDMAAETLRREGCSGRIPLLSADASGPCDRPNFSTGFLAGTASAESNALRPPALYQEHGIELKLDAPVTSLDTQSRHVLLADGTRHGNDKLLLATGAEPVRLDIPGAALDHVHYLRTLADSRTVVEKALIAKRAVVIGASFIGLGVASSLRARNVDEHVVAPDTIPTENFLGADVGNFICKLHGQHGVTFYLGNTAVSIDKQSVRLKNGESLQRWPARARVLAQVAGPVERTSLCYAAFKSPAPHSRLQAQLGLGRPDIRLRAGIGLGGFAPEPSNVRTA